MGDGREFEDVERLGVHGGTLVDVDNHAGFPSTREKALEVVCELALSEGDMLLEPGKYLHRMKGALYWFIRNKHAVSVCKRLNLYTGQILTLLVG